MVNIMRNIYILIGIFLGIIVISTVLKFFNINISSYINYLLWVVALGIFYIVLPSGKDSIF